jgi:hypothetical protein
MRLGSIAATRSRSAPATASESIRMPTAFEASERNLFCFLLELAGRELAILDDFGAAAASVVTDFTGA